MHASRRRPTGKMDPLPLMSTNVLMDPKQIMELYVDRWGLEVTFEESREHLGVETQRQWSEKAIERVTPILMGLYSLVCIMGNKLHEQGCLLVEDCAWYHKDCAIFSDMLRVTRMILWKDNLFSRKGKILPSSKNIPGEVEEWMEALVHCLLQAA